MKCEACGSIDTPVLVCENCSTPTPQGPTAMAVSLREALIDAYNSGFVRADMYAAIEAIERTIAPDDTTGVKNV